MTIKRSLFVSNILMLIIPIVLSIMLMSALMFVLMGLFGVDARQWYNEDIQFYQVIEVAKGYAARWEETDDLSIITADIAELWAQFGKKRLSLAVYRDEEVVYQVGSLDERPILIKIALSEAGGNYFSMNNFCVYTLDAGRYKVIFMDANFWFNGGFGFYDNRRNGYRVSLLILAALAFIIVATNRILTHKIFKRIMTPLDKLVYGVRQIRDGNLAYRIENARQDEFTPVFTDFNEMAERLLFMVNERQKDEEAHKELIAGISHDLRTPLTAIKTYVEGLELGIASTPQMRNRYWGTIKNKTKDLEHIINQLFLFSKLDIGEFPMQMEKQDIGACLADYVKAVGGEYRLRGLQIILEDRIPGTVLIDSVQFRNVLTNIAENSLKYKKKEEGTVRVTGYATEEQVVFTLTDDGPGVPEESLSVLFNVFYRGDKARSNTSQGSGLGLAISAKIIERFNGRIAAANGPEGGLAITIQLPLVL